MIPEEERCFLVTEETEIDGIGLDRARLEQMITVLENHVTFPGTNIEHINYRKNRLHLYPPDRGTMSSPLDEFSVHSLGKDNIPAQLEVSPFLESHHQRTYSGLRITINQSEYMLHRINQVPLRN